MTDRELCHTVQRQSLNAQYQQKQRALLWATMLLQRHYSFQSTDASHTRLIQQDRGSTKSEQFQGGNPRLVSRIQFLNKCEICSQESPLYFL